MKSLCQLTTTGIRDADAASMKRLVLLCGIAAAAVGAYAVLALFD